VVHRIIDVGRVKDRCAVMENICGYRARKFRGKISINIVMIIIFGPFSLFGRLYLTSFMDVETIFLLVGIVLIHFFTHLLQPGGRLKIVLFRRWTGLRMLGQRLRTDWLSFSFCYSCHNRWVFCSYLRSLFF